MNLHLPCNNIDISLLDTPRKLQALHERTNRLSLYDGQSTMNFPTSSSKAENCLHISTPLLGADDREFRRLKRYLTVEGELATSFKHCATEASPQELQIRALKQAMSILSSRAEEARERVERLRTVLAERNAEPEVYEKLQRERWMEEKRHIAVSEETKVVLQYLEVLNESSSDDRHVPDLPTPSLTAEARRDANLQKFLASSRTQAPIRIHRPSSTSFEHTSRRRTMDRVTPMKLRSSFTTPALSGISNGRSRTVSLDRAKPGRHPQPRSSNRLGPIASMTGLHGATILSVLAEDANSRTDGLPSPASESLDPSSCHLPLFQTLDSKPLTSADIELKPATLNSEELQDQGGTATIFHTVSHHPPDHVLANLHISLPDYALELFSHFEQNYMTPLNATFSFPTFSSIPQPSSPPSSVPAQRSPYIPASFLQPPSSTSPDSHSSSLRRKSSCKNLLPGPATSSRDGVQDGLGLGSAGSGFFSTPCQYPSTASLSLPVTANVTKKIKKPWSFLWRHS